MQVVIVYLDFCSINKSSRIIVLRSNERIEISIQKLIFYRNCLDAQRLGKRVTWIFENELNPRSKAVKNEKR